MRDIPNFEGLYAATEDGQIYSYKRKKFMKACGEKGNYQIMWLTNKDKVSKEYYVHRLVAMAFLPNPDNLPEVNHKDECKDHNSVDNLEWCDRKYNLNYGGNKRAIAVRCIELDKTYRSIYEAAKDMNAQFPNLCSHLKHNVPKSFAGYHWEYANK